MKHPLFDRLCALVLALCLCALPTLASADTYLPDGDVTHADFTLKLSLHADGFPQGKAHLGAWETFLNKLDLKGSMDSLALFTPDSRVYMNAALRLNGEEKLPFVYDGYHSYRYVTSPALNHESLHFQMHNFLEFMLKPYYYMELPTQYLALFLYPDAAYWLGDSYYTPVAELLASAREAAQNGETGEAGQGAEENASALSEAPAGDASSVETIGGADGPTAIYVAAPATAGEADASAADGALTYTVPYEDLYELCETLDLIVNDDEDLGRAYYFFTCLLTEAYASDMALSILGSLETELDNLDPDENGMTVTETTTGMTCTLGDTDLFVKTVENGVTAVTLTLPTSEGYVVAFDYRWDASGAGAALNAALTVTLDGQEAVRLAAAGAGLPREGDLDGEGNLTFTASGYTFTQEMAPLRFHFDWSRDAAQLPCNLALNIDWLHPETLKPALSLAFNGTLSTVDKSVFVEKAYPQNDFFNLNESFLDEYKSRLLPSLILKLIPFALEMPAGVIDDIYRFTADTDILVSFVE
jgi:hypothetical protein